MNKDFEEIFKPMYYLTTMCCVKKINFKKHEIFQIKKIDIFTSVFVNLGLLILYVITLTEYLSLPIESIIYYLYILMNLLYVMQHTILRIINFVQRKNNLALFLTLLNIYKHLSLTKELKKIKLQLNLPCTVYTCGYLILAVYKVSVDPNWSWYRGLLIFSTLIFDLELIYSGFIVYFIANKMKKLTKILKNVNDCTNNYEEVMRKIYKVYNMLINAVIFNENIFQISVIVNDFSNMF